MPVRRLSARRLWRTSRGGRVRVRALSCVCCCGLRRIRKPNEQRCALAFVARSFVDYGELVFFHRRTVQVVRGVLKRARAREDLDCGRARSGLMLGACESDAFCVTDYPPRRSLSSMCRRVTAGAAW